jgi:hypothetical protein
MFFSIDRERLSREILRSTDPQIYHFSSAYLVEPELGLAFRDTEQGDSVAVDFSPDTYGYNFDAARALFDQALEPLVANGTYRSGDVITLTYVINQGSEFDRLTFEFIQDAWTDTFNSSRFNIRVELELIPAPFPQNYFNYIIAGASDLGTGGISGSTLNASSFLGVYRYDNAGGFTLNWGMETREAVIPVVYEIQGETRQELWSFDAIHRALNGEVYLVNGQESFFPTARGFSAGVDFVSFEVQRLLDPAFRNIRYTLEVGGEAVAGFTNVPITSRFVNVTGLQSGTNYTLVLSFELADDGTTQTTRGTFATN